MGFLYFQTEIPVGSVAECPLLDGGVGEKTWERKTRNFSFFGA